MQLRTAIHSTVNLRNVLCAGALALLAPACVSSARYDAKVAELDTAQRELAKAKAAEGQQARRSSELNERLAKAQSAWLQESSKNQRLSAELQAEGQRVLELQQSMQEHEAMVTELESELAFERDLLAEFQSLAAAFGAGSPAELQATLAELQRRVDATERALREASNELERERRITQKLQRLIDAGKLRVHTRAGRLALELPGDIHFASGRADLTADGTATLAEVAGVLKAEQDRYFVVEGHTDNVPIAVSGFRSNWHLGATRAEMAREALVKAGLDSKRLAIATWADLLPVCPDVDTKECRQRNRRVEILLLPRFE
ncbi:MAG TPA: OmpA family protein [Polyangiaceae bacterium]|nr:OmpA family protein [Polyangiaceae bacterium]